MTLTAPQMRFQDAEERLFSALRIPMTSLLLHPDDQARRIHVLQTGAGEPLLLLHGGNSVAAAWAPLLAELDGAYRAYAPDRPGCGLSHPQDYRGVDFRDHAVTFVRTVMDGLGLERATLVGNSMGGFWSLLFALAEPDRVSAVVLLGEPAGSMAHPTLKHRLGATPGVNRLLFSTVARPRRGAALLAGLVAEPGRASAPLVDCLYAGAILPGANRAWRTMLENVAHPLRPTLLSRSLVPELPRLDKPVLIAWGERDFAPVEAGRAVAAALPDCRLEVVPGAGHLIWIDRPAQTGRLLTEFMGRVGARRAQGAESA